jgi:hypothetical protein
VGIQEKDELKLSSLSHSLPVAISPLSLLDLDALPLCVLLRLLSSLLRPVRIVLLVRSEEGIKVRETSRVVVHEGCSPLSEH